MNLCMTTTTHDDDDDDDDACDDVVIFSGLLWETRLVIISPKTQFENLSCYFFSFSFTCLALLQQFGTKVGTKLFRPSLLLSLMNFLNVKAQIKGIFHSTLNTHTHTKKEKVKKKFPQLT